MKTQFFDAYANPKTRPLLDSLWTCSAFFWGDSNLYRSLSPLRITHYDRNNMLRDLVSRLPRHYFKLAEVRDEIGRLIFPYNEYTAAGNNYCAWGESDMHPAEH